MVRTGGIKMKKIVSLILAFTMLMGTNILALAEVKEYIEPKLLVEYTFDDDVLDLPQGWQPQNPFASEHAYLQRQIAQSGKAFRLFDDNLSAEVRFISDPIKVKPGTRYVVAADSYSLLNEAMIQLWFQDEAGKNILVNTGYTVSPNVWNEVVATEIAPKEAVCLRASLLTHVREFEADVIFDNVKIFEGEYRKSTKPEMKLAPEQKDAVNSKIVEPVGDKLKYNTFSEKGDTLFDYSYAGFHAGKYELPDSSKLPLAMELSPSGDKNADDTPRIQAAIDKISEEAPNTYMRVLKLKAGRYNISSKGIQLKSGIVLSGEGQGPDGTVLYAFDKQQYAVISVQGLKNKQLTENAYITEPYIEAGSFDFTIDPSKVADYKVGDLITIYHPSEEEWSKAMGMYNFTTYTGTDGTWDNGEVDFAMERTITAIDGNKITVDMPFPVQMDTSLSKCYIYKIDDSGKVENVGVENLRVEAYFNGNPVDEQHADTGVMFGNAKNCYVRDISTKFLVQSLVTCAKGSKQITIKNCSFLEPVSIASGGRRYSFNVSNAQQILISGCYSYDARHEFVTNNPGNTIIFHDSISDRGVSPSEPHGIWTVGVLYDNVYFVGENTRGSLSVKGTDAGVDVCHGWCGASVVMWNCLSPAIIAHKPPLTYQNFIVGQWGFYNNDIAKNTKRVEMKSAVDHYGGIILPDAKERIERISDTSDDTSFVGDAYKEAETTPVEPRSLYKAQLAERATGSFKNAKPNAPVIVDPRGEIQEAVKSNDVEITGLYQKGAEKVTVYIDNTPYEAKLNTKDNMFSLNVTLKDGTHKVHATQTINGVEGTKCADRFVVVNRLSGYADYLSSEYEYDKTVQVTNDARPTFDVYQEPFENQSPDVITVKIGDSLLETDVDPVEINGRVLVPMRAIFEAFEADVIWDEATKTATTIRGDLEIKVTENNNVAKINGQDYILDVPATIIDGRFVVPVRFIAENFGAKVDWLDLRRRVLITDGAPKYSLNHGLENEVKLYGMEWGGGNQLSTTTIGPKVFDNNYTTEWVVGSHPDMDTPYCIMDLGFSRRLKDFYISYTNLVRKYKTTILVSEDGVNYTEVTKTEASGETLELQKFPLNTKGRYVKVLFHGNQEVGKEQWNNITEITITQDK